MEEFKQWLADMKEHYEGIRALELQKKDRNNFVSDDFDTLDELVAFRDGQIDFLEMCQNWFKPNYMRFNPKEAAKEL